jgi:hypothetical protein
MAQKQADAVAAARKLRAKNARARKAGRVAERERAASEAEKSSN